MTIFTPASRYAPELMMKEIDDALGQITAGEVPEAPIDGGTYGRSNAAWIAVLSLSGGMMTGPITLSADPAAAMQPVTLQYYNAHLPPSSITVGTTPIGGGTSGSVVYDNAGVIGEAANFTISGGNPNVTAGNAYLYNGVNALKMITGQSDLMLGNSGNLTMTGAYNVAAGWAALAAATTGGYNVAIGGNALGNDTTGQQNVAIGYNALNANVAGNYSVAIGQGALAYFSAASGNNVAIGYAAMGASGATTPSTSVAVGYGALQNNSGSSNIGVGYNSGLGIASGGGNIAIGSNALSATTTASSLIAIGSNALQHYTSPSSGSVAIGQGALAAATTGASNVAIGYTVLGNNTTGANNVAIGYNAMNAAGATAPTSSVAIGYAALQNNNASSNTAVGASAMVATTTGGNNTAIGSGALGANTTGTLNVAVGTNAMSGAGATAPTQSIAIGYQALSVNNASGNIGIGSNALAANTTGSGNVAIGSSTLTHNTTGGSNFGLGGNILNALTTGSSNIAIGSATATGLIDGTGNIMLGGTAGNAIVHGNYNLFMGISAGAAGGDITGCIGLGLYSLNKATGNYNVTMGSYCGQDITSGIGNILIGDSTTYRGAANNLTTGSYNVLIGYNVGAPSITANGQLNIQNVIYGTGNTATGVTVSTGNIGIGVQAPGAVLSIRANTAAAAHLNMAAGATPTTPADGDMWYDGTHLNFRHGGVTSVIV
jgi:hypothetical protein